MFNCSKMQKNSELQHWDFLLQIYNKQKTMVWTIAYYWPSAISTKWMTLDEPDCNMKKRT